MEIITLDVSGQIFRVKKDILLRIPYFNNLFSDCGGNLDAIFVARPSNIFKHVIGIVIDDLYPYPSKYAFELDFYGINFKRENLYDDTGKALNTISNILTEIDKMNDKITSNHAELVNSIGANDPAAICIFEDCGRLSLENENYCKAHEDEPVCCRRGCVNYKQSGFAKYFCRNHS
jgi:hypothetical protein